MSNDNTTEYKGYAITIEQDNNPDSPREWDNLGTMVCAHRRYHLGDEQFDGHYYDGGPLKEFLNRKDILWLPLYLYDHSGITMNTTGFSCPWDSGMVGFIYVTKEDVLKEFKHKIVDKKLKDHVYKILKGEVETYDQYLTGDVYGYIITDPDGNETDSCWGFYGYKYCLEEAQSMVDWHVKNDLQVATEAPAFMI